MRVGETFPFHLPSPRHFLRIDLEPPSSCHTALFCHASTTTVWYSSRTSDEAVGGGWFLYSFLVNSPDVLDIPGSLFRQSAKQGYHTQPPSESLLTKDQRLKTATACYLAVSMDPIRMKEMSIRCLIVACWLFGHKVFKMLTK